MAQLAAADDLIKSHEDAKNKEPYQREGYGVKQVIVVRKDLNCQRGKEIAQGSHASMMFISKIIQSCAQEKTNILEKLSEEQWKWFNGSFAKITLQVNSEEELRDVHEKALAAGLDSNLVIDSGKTVFKGVPTPTCCGIGPHYSDKFVGITSHLKLY